MAVDTDIMQIKPIVWYRLKFRFISENAFNLEWILIDTQWWLLFFILFLNDLIISSYHILLSNGRPFSPSLCYHFHDCIELLNNHEYKIMINRKPLPALDHCQIKILPQRLSHFHVIATLNTIEPGTRCVLYCGVLGQQGSITLGRKEWNQRSRVVDGTRYSAWIPRHIVTSVWTFAV